MTPGWQNNMAPNCKLHSEGVPSLPKYRETLALEERKGYEKLKLIDNIDPYNVSNF